MHNPLNARYLSSPNVRNGRSADIALPNGAREYALMRRWWLVGLVVLLFIAGLAWKLNDASNCSEVRGIVLALLTAHQECVRR